MGKNAFLSILAWKNCRHTSSYGKNTSWKNLCFVLRNQRIVGLILYKWKKIAYSFFSSSKNSGFVDQKKVENYIVNRQKFVSKGRGTDFKIAVQQMDEYISNPTVKILNLKSCMICDLIPIFGFYVNILEIPIIRIGETRSTKYSHQNWARRSVPIENRAQYASARHRRSTKCLHQNRAWSWMPIEKRGQHISSMYWQTSQRKKSAVEFSQLESRKTIARKSNCGAEVRKPS